VALRPTRSIKVPIVLAAVAVVLSLAMLVGWILVVARDFAAAERVVLNTWLMVAGILSLVAIITGLVLISVFLVREILESRKQVRFIDSVTHELKSPLASLKLCLQTLARPGLSEERRRKLEGMMLDDINRLSGFIDDVLESSRIAMGKGALRLDEVELAEIAQLCARRVRARFRAEDDAVEIHVPEDLVVLADRTALETVLTNLLDNAVKYSPRPAQVVLTALRRDGEVLLEVRDRGIGIPKAYQRKVFDRFYRAPGEGVASRRGTGLGLFVAASLVRNLGGRLEAHSPGTGLGTTLRFRLREAPPTAQAAPAPALEAP